MVMVPIKSGRKIRGAEIRERLYRRRYVVPNAVTVGNMFCGFLAIIYSASDRFEKAAIAILFAILLDGLDGRVARRLNATSKFGVEFDSFSDLVSFGVAPALLLYHWGFQKNADEFGVLVTFIYATCAASRLARFNIMQENLKTFLGLPSPGAAAGVATLVMYSPRVEQSVYLETLCACVMLGLGFLMVSRIEFFSIKLLKISGLRLVARILMASLIALIWYKYQVGLLVLSYAYALSGPLNYLKRGKGIKVKVGNSVGAVVSESGEGEIKSE